MASTSSQTRVQEFKDWEFTALNENHSLVYQWWSSHPPCWPSQTRIQRLKSLQHWTRPTDYFMDGGLHVLSVDHHRQEFKDWEFTALNKTHSLVYWWWPPHPLCWLSQTRVQAILGLFPAHIPLTGQLVWKTQNSIRYSWKWTHLQPLALFAFPHINPSPEDAIFKTKQNKQKNMWNRVEYNSNPFRLQFLFLYADWSVISKFEGVFDLMHINESQWSFSATAGHLLSCCVGKEELLTSDTNPSVVARTFLSSLRLLSSFNAISVFSYHWSYAVRPFINRWTWDFYCVWP